MADKILRPISESPGVPSHCTARCNRRTRTQARRITTYSLELEPARGSPTGGLPVTVTDVTASFAAAQLAINRVRLGLPVVSESSSESCRSGASGASDSEL